MHPAVAGSEGTIQIRPLRFKLLIPETGQFPSRIVVVAFLRLWNRTAVWRFFRPRLLGYWRRWHLAPPKFPPSFGRVLFRLQARPSEFRHFLADDAHVEMDRYAHGRFCSDRRRCDRSDPQGAPSRCVREVTLLRGKGVRVRRDSTAQVRGRGFCSFSAALLHLFARP
jgi:hypothetical protein